MTNYKKKSIIFVERREKLDMIYKEISVKKALVLGAILTISLTACTSGPQSAPEAFLISAHANEWVYSHISYLNTVNGKSIDEMQTPQETLSLGTGNCIDMANLEVYLLKQSGYPKAEMVPLYNASKNIYHVVVYDGNGLYFDPTADSGYLLEFPKGYKLTTW